jgi:hypothetical protein
MPAGSRLMWRNRTSILNFPTHFKHVRVVTDVWCNIRSVGHKYWLIHGNRSWCTVRTALRLFHVILKSINCDVFRATTACVLIYANLIQNKSKGIYVDTYVYGLRHLLWGFRFPVCRKVDDVAIGHPCTFYLVLYREDRDVAACARSGCDISNGCFPYIFCKIPLFHKSELHVTSS